MYLKSGKKKMSTYLTVKSTKINSMSIMPIIDNDLRGEGGRNEPVENGPENSCVAQISQTLKSI